MISAAMWREPSLLRKRESVVPSQLVCERKAAEVADLTGICPGRSSEALADVVSDLIE